MINSRVEKFFLNIIKTGIILILFLPLLVYRPVLYPYVFSKILSFQFIVEIIFIIWLFLALYFGKKYRPDWKNPLVIALTIFMGILFLTSLTGIDSAKSFWSTQERMTGIITLLHFYAFFIILISTFKNKRDWQKFIGASLIYALFVGLYGIGQKQGLNFLIKTDLYQMNSTLGNPIFLAVYSMLHIFLAGFILSQKNSKKIKIICSALIIFNIWIMLAAASRGVMLAFGFGLFLFLLFLIFSTKYKKIKISLGLFLTIIIASLVFIQLPVFKPYINKMPRFIGRLASFTSSTESRILSWNIGWQGFKERPILGWGWENYNIIFNQNYQPSFLNSPTGLEVTWYDHSHNQIIDILALTGILGILSYLAIFGIVFWLLFKKIKILDNLKQKIPFVLLGLMFLAYFIQNLFVFDTPAPLIVFYFSLALEYFVTQNKRSDLQPEVRPRGGSSFPLPVLILLIVIFLPWAMYKFNIEPFQQSRLGVKAIHASKIDLKSGLHWYEQALAKPCFTNPEIRVYLAQTVSEQYSKMNKETTLTELNLIGEATEMAIMEYKKSVQEHPLNARHWLYLGQLYNLGVGYNKEYVQKADEVLHKALELSPKRQQVYFELARAQLFLQEYEKAVELLKQAVILDPEVKTSRQNLEKVLKTLKEQKPELVEKTEQFLKELEN